MSIENIAPALAPLTPGLGAVKPKEEEKKAADNAAAPLVANAQLAPVQEMPAPAALVEESAQKV